MKQRQEQMQRRYGKWCTLVCWLGSVGLFGLVQEAHAQGIHSAQMDTVGHRAPWASQEPLRCKACFFYTSSNSNLGLTSFVVTFLLPPVGAIFNLYSMVRGKKEERYYWGLWNGIIWGIAALIPGILLFVFPFATVEFFVCLGLALGFLPFSILGFVNVGLAAGMSEFPRRREPFGEREFGAVSVRGFVPLWRYSF